MELKVGAVLEGKVKTITNFGAFVTLPENRTGMVHISEVANCYVSDIRQHLTEGQTVKVKVMKIDEGGKVALSVKKAEESPIPRGNKPQGDREAQRETLTRSTPSSMSFDEKVKQFLSDSDSKISGCKIYERRSKTRKR